MDLSIKILVADDFLTMRRIIKTILKKAGFNNIIEAEDGAFALDKIKKNDIGLIISDWNMPNMTGLELLKEVRSRDEYKHIPFLMVTAEGQKLNVVDAIKFGVTNYVVKPFTEEILLEKINRIFAG